MSKTSLDRIEKTLEKLVSQQGEICERLARLETSGPAPVASRDELLTFLDNFRAGEALGEVSLGAWIAVCETDCLRGGLRTVQMREGSHARLLEERIKELGGSASFEIPAETYDKAMRDVGSSERSDVVKLQEFTKQFPDPEAAIQPILDFADRLDGDQETQFLLRTIAQDELSTLKFLQDACALLSQ